MLGCRTGDDDISLLMAAAKIFDATMKKYYPDEMMKFAAINLYIGHNTRFDKNIQWNMVCALQ